MSYERFKHNDNLPRKCKHERNISSKYILGVKYTSDELVTIPFVPPHLEIDYPSLPEVVKRAEIKHEKIKGEEINERFLFIILEEEPPVSPNFIEIKLKNEKGEDFSYYISQDIDTFKNRQFERRNKTSSICSREIGTCDIGPVTAIRVHMHFVDEEKLEFLFKDIPSGAQICYYNRHIIKKAEIIGEELHIELFRPLNIFEYANVYISSKNSPIHLYLIQESLGKVHP